MGSRVGADAYALPAKTQDIMQSFLYRFWALAVREPTKLNQSILGLGVRTTNEHEAWQF